MMYLLLLIGFVLLIKGADLFVDGSSSIAGILKVPSVIIGLTIVAMGTSAPEAAVSINAGLAGNSDISLGKGTALIQTEAVEGLFYNVLGETTGLEINNDEELVSMLCALSEAKHEYDKISNALAQVRQTGYGIVSPGIEELSLREPEIIRQGGRYGVRLRASAPSIHMICNKPKFLKTA